MRPVRCSAESWSAPRNQVLFDGLQGAVIAVATVRGFTSAEQADAAFLVLDRIASTRLPRRKASSSA